MFPIKITGRPKFNKYLVARNIDLHRTSKFAEVAGAVDFLCDEIGYNNNYAKRNMKVVICDLFHNYKSMNERYLYIVMKEKDLALINRYNALRVSYHPFRQVVLGLEDHGYLERKKGTFSFDFLDGYRTRIRATEKLISLMADTFKISKDMLQISDDKEGIVKKGKRIENIITVKNLKTGKVRKIKIKVKPLVDYVDTHHIKTMRNKLDSYNKLLNKTYIDLDSKSYVRSKKSREPIFIDLSDKKVKRVFNNDSWLQGGRFYGGWWQRIPEDLRERIIIDGHNVVEFDFSGMHIHIMYALEGKKLKDFNREPYIFTKNNDTDNIRPFIKRLFLTAVNCEDDTECLRSLRKHLRENAGSYPEKAPNLKELLTIIREYHPEISNYINKGKGPKFQYFDSLIAEITIDVLTKKGIPVLCVHDSFVCKNIDSDVVIRTMKEAYIKVLNTELRKHGNQLTPEEVETTVTDIRTKQPSYVNKVRNTWQYVLNPVFSYKNDQHRRHKEFLDIRRRKTNFSEVVVID